MSDTLLDLSSGKITCVDHKVGSVLRGYGTFSHQRTFASEFAVPCEIKQPLGSTETWCVREPHTRS